MRHIINYDGRVLIANLAEDPVLCWNDKSRPCSDNCSAFALERDHVVYCNAAGAPIGRLLTKEK